MGETLCQWVATAPKIAYGGVTIGRDPIAELSERTAQESQLA
jgi:hypothetical protein